MRFISICSGIEAASVAFSPLGWKAIAFSEIEPFPCAVLKHHYPDVPNFGDMTDYKSWPEEIFFEADAIVGGPPCQAFSVAGMRKGLDDARGNLTLTYVELINHADAIRVRNGKPPVVVLYENVPGLLSDKTNAFGCFLGALAGEDDPLIPPGGKWTNAGCVYGPQRTVAWRVFDAQYFGVAQRRRRVFVVASARNDFDPAAVLFEFDGVRRDAAPSRETRKATTGGAGTGAESGGGGLIGATHNGSDVYPTLDTSMDRKFGSDQWVNNGFGVFAPVSQLGDTTPTLTSNGDAHSGFRDEHGLVPVGVTIHGTDKTARVASYTDIAGCLRADVPGRIENSSTTVVQQPIHEPFTLAIRGRGDTHQLEYRQDGTANALLTPNGGRGGIGVGAVAQPIALQDITPREKAQNGKGWNDDGTAYTVDTHATQGVAQPVAFAQNQRDEVRIMQVAGALAAEPGAKQQTYLAQPIGWDEELNASVEQSGTLLRGGQGGRHDGVMTQAMQVRRLTPVECCRLQGFPDDYLTQVPWRGKPTPPDGPMYKALGNSWAVPNVRWIGKRIQEALNALP